MFKLLLLCALVSMVAGAPSGLIAPLAYHAAPLAVVHPASYIAAPTVVHAAPVVASIPTSYSSQSSTVVHSSKPAYLAAPLVSAYSHHGLVAPVAVSAW